MAPVSISILNKSYLIKIEKKEIKLWLKKNIL